MGKTSSSREASSSKSLLFMMVAMICGWCALLSGGMMMASRVIRAVQLRAGSDKSTVRTPLGDFRFEKAKQVGPGLPLYPQSELVLPGADSSRLSLSGDAAQVMYSTYHTNTSRQFVVDWYQEHLSPTFTRQDSGPKNLPAIFNNSHITDGDVAFVGERDDQVRVVALSADNTGTRITLLRATNLSSTPTPTSSPTPTP